METLSGWAVPPLGIALLGRGANQWLIVLR
jgi:hypothetical protein